MCERGRERDARIRRVEVELRGSHVLVGRYVAVRQHHALGLARGARGIDQRGKILRFYRPHQRIKHRIALAATRIGAREQVSESNRSCWRRRRFHDQYPFQVRLVAHGIQLVKLLPR